MNSRISHFISALLGAAVVAVVVVALALAGTFESDGDDGNGAATAPQPAATASPNQRDASVSEVYERVKGGVVQVIADAGALRLPFETPEGEEPRRTGTGSGFFIDDEGHIITNQHVVEDSEEVRVAFGDDPTQDPIRARVVGADASTDLAVIKVDPEDVEGGIDALELGSSEGVKVGQPTIAMGSPFGLDGSLTTGVVSAVGRNITAPNGFGISNVVQTDAAINPGNSGGPLLDGNGRVIGINAQIATDGSRANSGVGFAIPVDTAKEVVPQLQENGRIERAYMGVSTAPLTPSVARRLDIDAKNGVVVAEVVSGGPADEAGLRARDVITKFAGEDVRLPEQVVEAVSTRKPGDEVEVEIVRGGNTRTVTVELARRPRQARQG